MEKHVCSICGKNYATHHLVVWYNGQFTEEYYCSECENKSRHLRNNFNSEATASYVPSEPRCNTCGTPLSAVKKSLYVGCPDCYNAFRDQLLPKVFRLHGSKRHIGKRPVAGGFNGDIYRSIRDDFRGDADDE